jgi:hypothetical protein
LPDYNPSVTNLRRIDGGTAPGAGAEYVFDLQLPGADTPMETPLRVLAADAPHRIEFETGPGFMAREVCTFEATAAGTVARFEIALSLPGDVDPQVRTTMEATLHEQARLELEQTKKALES